MTKKMKHNYTSELELKSLLIRIKNDREDICTQKHNKVINKYIKWHTAVNSKKYEDSTKKSRLKNRLKDRIITLSEQTRVDGDSYERFGAIILLMVKNILRKPQFSGYTYVDDFYSDAVYKILRYLHNFDHNKISERTGFKVNAFAYISQIIHNSVIFIINSKKTETDNIKKQICMSQLDDNLQLKAYEVFNDRVYREEMINKETGEYDMVIDELDGSLFNTLSDINFPEGRVNVVYPHDYRITFDEYNKLKSILNSNISIVRAKA
jgi:DNA-directed RNA polymerase specialized sigma24 family protein